MYNTHIVHEDDTLGLFFTHLMHVLESIYNVHVRVIQYTCIAWSLPASVFVWRPSSTSFLMIMFPRVFPSNSVFDLYLLAAFLFTEFLHFLFLHGCGRRHNEDLHHLRWVQAKVRKACTRCHPSPLFVHVQRSVQLKVHKRNSKQNGKMVWTNTLYN